MDRELIFKTFICNLHILGKDKSPWERQESPQENQWNPLAWRQMVKEIILNNCLGCSSPWFLSRTMKEKVGKVGGRKMSFFFFFCFLDWICSLPLCWVLGVGIETKSNSKYQVCEVIFPVLRLQYCVLRPVFAALLLVLILVYTVSNLPRRCYFFISNLLLSWIYFLYPCHPKQVLSFLPLITTWVWTSTRTAALEIYY